MNKYSSSKKLLSINKERNPYLSNNYEENQITTTFANGHQIRQVFNSNKQVVKEYLKQSNSPEQLMCWNLYDVYGSLMYTKDYITGNETKYLLDSFGSTISTLGIQHGQKVNIHNTYDIEHKNIIQSDIEIDCKLNRYSYKYTDTPDSRLTSVQMPNGTVENITYDKLLRIDTICTGSKLRKFSYLTKGDHTTNLVSKICFNNSADFLKYNYDDNGNVVEIWHSNNLIARYCYDGINRLIREDNKLLNKTSVFTYDAGGNITERREYSFLLDYCLDDKPCRSYVYNYPLTGWRDQLLAYDGKPIVYDKIGNPTIYKGDVLTWNYVRLLKSYNNITYNYNSNGIRVCKTVDGVKTKYILNGTQLLALIQDDHVMTFYYGVGGVSGFSLDGLDYQYKKNLQNDVIAIINREGKEIVNYAYDAWGMAKKCLFCQNLSKNDISVENYDTMGYNITEQDILAEALNPFRYRSYIYDGETNLYYLNSRYYDPETGRFINADDIEYVQPDKINGLNLYAYCLNNPVNNVDYSGRFGIFAILAIAIASAFIGATAQIISNKSSSAKNSEIWRGVAGSALGAAINSLVLCIAMPLGIGAFFLAAGAGTLVQTGTDAIESLIRKENLDVKKSFLDFDINFLSSFIGNFIGSEMVPTNSGWFQPKKFLSVFLKSYGQKILTQTAIGSLFSGVINFIRNIAKNEGPNYFRKFIV